MRKSHNLPLPPRIYIPSIKHPNATVGHSRNPAIPGQKYTPLLNIYTRASRNLLLPPKIYPPKIYQNIAFFYNVILTESTPLSCLDKCAFSRRCIYRAYISSLGTQCVQCIRTVTVPHTRGCSISGGSRMWRKGGGGVRGFWGLPQDFLGTF